MNIGWKLAAVLKGSAPHRLLESYEAERRPVAIRNTGFARQFADSLGLFTPKPGLEDDTDEGEALRREAGAYLEAHGKAEFDIPGITLGARYDGSPVICTEPGEPAADLPNCYVPSAAPGGRAPHWWIGPDTSLYDRFGFDWTLLRLGESAPDGARFVAAAANAGMELKLLNLASEEIAALYGAPLVLIRPDQVVAWRGDDDRSAVGVVDRVTSRALP